MHAQSYLTLCDCMDYSLPGLSVHGLLQTRILEWIAISYSRGSSPPRDWTHISWIGRQILYHCATWEALGGDKNRGFYLIKKVKVTQSFLTLCNLPTPPPADPQPMDYTVHGILQVRILEWVAIPFSRGIFPTQGSNPGLPHCRLILYQLSHKGSPNHP